MGSFALGLLVALIGIIYGFATPQNWTAERTVVIVPNSEKISETASLYESLSRGQIPATAAEIYGQKRWHPDTPAVKVVAGVIPPSAVLQVTATGTNRADVEATLSRVIDTATPQVNITLAPYRISILDDQQAVARTSGLSTGSWAAIGLAGGLLVGAAGFAFLTAIRTRWMESQPARRAQLDESRRAG